VASTPVCRARPLPVPLWVPVWLYSPLHRVISSVSLAPRPRSAGRRSPHPQTPAPRAPPAPRPRHTPVILEVARSPLSRCSGASHLDSAGWRDTDRFAPVLSRPSETERVAETSSRATPGPGGQTRCQEAVAATHWRRRGLRLLTERGVPADPHRGEKSHRHGGAGTRPPGFLAPRAAATTYRRGWTPRSCGTNYKILVRWPGHPPSRPVAGYRGLPRP